MSSDPRQLEQRRIELERSIRAAWKGVTREGSVSWNETQAHDDWKSEEMCLRVRQTDRDVRWEELLDYPEWLHSRGSFNFLDWIGFRYYVAPAMILTLRGWEWGCGQWFEHHLGMVQPDYIQRLSDEQRRVTAEFIKHMIEKTGDSCWRSALDPWRYYTG